MQRDTDQDWQLLADANPYFGVLSNEQFLGSELTREVRDEFYQTGVVDIDYILQRIRETVAPAFAPVTAVDFGCGVGRLTLPMAAHSGRVIGVDVADGMLRVAEAQRDERGLGNVEFTSDIPAGPVDWVNSLIVFQHIPPARGTELIETLVRSLAPGGVLSIQVTYFRDARHVGELQRDLGDFRYDGESVTLMSLDTTVAPGSMTMYDYDLNSVFRVLHRNGVTRVFTEPTDHAGCHGVRLFGVRD